MIGALAHLEEALGARPKLMAVAGYSFGSYVGAMAAAADQRVGFYLGIAPPLNRYDFGFLRQAICRVALIGGTHDEFCEAARFEALYLSLPATPWTRVLDTDHFFSDARGRSHPGMPRRHRVDGSARVTESRWRSARAGTPGALSQRLVAPQAVVTALNRKASESLVGKR